ncbi:MAG: hypothetical protein FWH48_04055, partial [Oscillospiraceae bacterium]|nr:hypothetical protein [Oscillospiraceae bacterium]
MDVDGASGGESSVSIDWRELHMNYTAIRRSVHIRYTYADSSFAKGAFGDISMLVFISVPVFPLFFRLLPLFRAVFKRQS